MATIRDLAYGYDAQGQQTVKSPWREALQPASFRNAYFHAEASGIENGRRIVMHEFPKKNVPYAEDMGRRAYEFTVRGYCIQYPHDVEGAGMELYRRDYRVARDILARELSSGEPGRLRLPNMKGNEMVVICPRFRVTEEDRSGGYCVFDMTFVEQGAPPREPPPDPRDVLIKRYQDLMGSAIDKTKAGPSGPGNSTGGVGV